MGFGDRYDPLDGGDVRFAMRGTAEPGQPKRLVNYTPGVGEYDIGKNANQNDASKWK